MRKVIFTILLISFTFTRFGYEDIKGVIYDFGVEDFKLSLKNLKKWEGNYSNLEHDKGGETYCGITRNFNKKWEGWKVIDKYKLRNKIEWNTKVPGMDKYVYDYYYSLWIKEKFYLIEESKTAIYLFDYRNTGPVAIKHIKQVLRNHGHKVTVNSVMDLKTISAINRMNPQLFLKKIKERRIQYYHNVVIKNPKLSIYLVGWTRRANFL